VVSSAIAPAEDALVTNGDSKKTTVKKRGGVDSDTAAFSPKDDRYQTMQYRRAGRSGLKLPAISLGLWHNFGRPADFETPDAVGLRSFHHRLTPLRPGDQKRRILDVVAGIDVGAFIDEEAGNLDLIALRRGQQRGAASAVAGIDVDTLGQEPADNQDLAALGRRDQPILGERPSRGDQQHQKRKQKGGRRRPHSPR